MIFNDIQSAQDFYIAYASHVGFSVRVGQQKKKIVLFCTSVSCARNEGFRVEKAKNINESTKKRKCDRKIR